MTGNLLSVIFSPVPCVGSNSKIQLRVVDEEQISNAIQKLILFIYLSIFLNSHKWHKFGLKVQQRIRQREIPKQNTYLNISSSTVHEIDSFILA